MAKETISDLSVDDWVKLTKQVHKEVLSEDERLKRMDENIEAIREYKETLLTSQSV